MWNKIEVQFCCSHFPFAPKTLFFTAVTHFRIQTLNLDSSGASSRRLFLDVILPRRICFLMRAKQREVVAVMGELLIVVHALERKDSPEKKA
jgi:hypothetical protein